MTEPSATATAPPAAPGAPEQTPSQASTPATTPVSTPVSAPATTPVSAASASPPPTATWLLAALLVNQTLLYLAAPTLIYVWEYYVLTATSSAIAIALLVECRHWVNHTVTHVIHGLIVLDTFFEGFWALPALHEAGAPKRPGENLWCVAAFAAVYMIWLAYCRLRWKTSP